MEIKRSVDQQGRDLKRVVPGKGPPTLQSPRRSPRKHPTTEEVTPAKYGKVNAAVAGSSSSGTEVKAARKRLTLTDDGDEGEGSEGGTD
jgi:hypothetical protein